MTTSVQFETMRVAAYRDARGRTATDLAASLNASKPTWSNWMRSSEMPRERLEVLARELGTTPEMLIPGGPPLPLDWRVPVDVEKLRAAIRFRMTSERAMAAHFNVGESVWARWMKEGKLAPSVMRALVRILGFEEEALSPALPTPQPEVRFSGEEAAEPTPEQVAAGAYVADDGRILTPEDADWDAGDLERWSEEREAAEGKPAGTP